MSAIATRLTPPGRGAVAVIACQGDPTRIIVTLSQHFQTQTPTPWQARPQQQLIYGRWGNTPPENVVVCRTAEQTWEIQCHGGDAAVRRILTDLEGGGLTLMTRQASAHPGSTSLDQEYQDALSQALTWRTADLINEQAQGLFFHTIDEQLHRLNRVQDRLFADQQLTSLLKWKSLAAHLTQPWSVVLIGRPNVGKSSLMNALLGYRRSIVTQLAGTTRDVVSSVTGFDGWPIQISDTAGLRPTNDALESAGILRGQLTTTQADLRVLLIDSSSPPHPTDWELLKQYPEALLVAHKCDRDYAWGAELPGTALPVSSVTGAGLERLIQEVTTRLIPEVPPAGTAWPVTIRQVTLLEQALCELRNDRVQNCCHSLRSLIDATMRVVDADLSSVNAVG